MTSVSPRRSRPFRGWLPLRTFDGAAAVRALALLMLMSGGSAQASDVPAGSDLFCGGRPACRRPPGPPNVDARPFADTLGRPCGYRERATPSGTRRVRVCY